MMRTVLKKLCERGIFQNENAVISSLIKKDEFYARQSRRFVGRYFRRPLPKFPTAFIGGKRLSDRQAEELKKLIDEHREGNFVSFTASYVIIFVMLILLANTARTGTTLSRHPPRTCAVKTEMNT